MVALSANLPYGLVSGNQRIGLVANEGFEYNPLKPKLVSVV